jgi:hypothetical protein
MQPLYLARIEDLGHGDLVKVDCAAVALLTPEFLLRLGLSPQDLKERVRRRGWGARGRAVVSIKWGAGARELIYTAAVLWRYCHGMARW